MANVNHATGKSDTGGSIIMVASVAGIRSGAGAIDCMHATPGFSTIIEPLFLQTVQAKRRKYDNMQHVRDQSNMLPLQSEFHSQDWILPAGRY